MTKFWCVMVAGGHTLYCVSASYIYMCIFSTGGSVLDSFVIFTPVLLKIA